MKTVAKAITILELFTREEPWLGVTEIATRLDLHKGTVHLILSTLRKSGYVIYNPQTRKYGLGFKLRDLADRVNYGQDLRDICLPRMVTLARDSKEDVSLSIPVEDKWVIIAVAHGTQFVRQDVRQGRTLPLYCGAGGRCILAYMDEARASQIVDALQPVAHTEHTITDKRRLLDSLAEIRSQSYAVGVEEFYPDAAAVAFPLLGADGVVLGACTVHSTVSRMDAHLTRRLVSIGLEAVREMNQTLKGVDRTL